MMQLVTAPALLAGPCAAAAGRARVLAAGACASCPPLVLARQRRGQSSKPGARRSGAGCMRLVTAPALAQGSREHRERSRRDHQPSCASSVCSAPAAASVLAFLQPVPHLLAPAAVWRFFRKAADRRDRCHSWSGRGPGPRLGREVHAAGRGPGPALILGYRWTEERSADYSPAAGADLGEDGPRGAPARGPRRRPTAMNQLDAPSFSRGPLGAALAPAVWPALRSRLRLWRNKGGCGARSRSPRRQPSRAEGCHSCSAGCGWVRDACGWLARAGRRAGKLKACPP